MSIQRQRYGVGVQACVATQIFLMRRQLQFLPAPNAVHKHARSKKGNLVNDPGVLMSEHTRLALAKIFQECGPWAAGFHSDIQLVDSAP